MPSENAIYLNIDDLILFIKMKILLVFMWHYISVGGGIFSLKYCFFTLKTEK